MTNKKYISGLLISLLAFSGCAFDSTSNGSNQNSSASSTSENNNNSNVSSSTSDTKNQNYFNAEDTALLEDYFGFVLPSLDLDYTLEDYSSTLGYTCVVIYFDNASEDDFVSYRDLLGKEYTFVEEGEYESDYWYIYSEENFSIETCYDDYSEDLPFIYLQIHDASALDDDGGDSGEDITLKDVVNGSFDAEDTALLDGYFDFDFPAVGQYYVLIDDTVQGLVDVYLYFYGVDASDFAAFQSELESFATYDGTEVDTDYGYTLHLYSSGDYYIDVVFDDSVEGEEFIYANIYDSSLLGY